MLRDSYSRIAHGPRCHPQYQQQQKKSVGIFSMGKGVIPIPIYIHPHSFPFQFDFDCILILIHFDFILYYNLVLCIIQLEMHVRLICAIEFYLHTYLLT